jgi:hypothetical protein
MDWTFFKDTLLPIFGGVGGFYWLIRNDIKEISKEIHARVTLVEQNHREDMQLMDDKFQKIDEKWSENLKHMDAKWSENLKRMDDKWERLFERLLLKDEK